MKRVLTLTLVCLMLLSTLVGCGLFGGKENEDSESEESSEVTSSVSDDGSGRDDDDVLPKKGEIDFKGAKYQVLSRSSTAYEFDPDVVGGSGGSNVSKAIYNRNKAVEDRFNVNIKVVQEPGEWANKDDFAKRVEGEAMAGYTEVSLVASHSNYIAQMASNGYAFDLNELSYVDYTKEWWSEAFYNDCLINGKCYFMIGDITYTFYERMEVVYFNQTLITANGYTESMYDLVEDKKWTYDRMKTMALEHAPSVAAGTPTDYAILFNSHSVKALLTGMEVEFTTPDENGRHQPYAELPATMITIIDNVIEDIYSNNTIRWDRATAADADFGTKTFSEGHALFYAQYLAEAKNISADMKQDFGILPMPLADEAQDWYLTGGCDNMTGIMVLSNCTQSTMVGLITEALSMYSYQLVRPEYYEVSLKKQYTDDAEVVEMLDLIRGCYKMPFGLVYATVLGSSHPYWQIEMCYVENGASSISTKYGNNLEAYKKNIQKMYDTYDGKS